MDFRGPRFAASADVCGRDVAPKETFTRFQLAAVSSIFMDFRGFHRFIDSSNHRIWRLGWLARLGWAGWLFHRFSWISGDFMRFHGFQGSEVSRPLPTFANGMMPLKKPLLDPSWLLFHRFSWISEDFIDFMYFMHFH